MSEKPRGQRLVLLATSLAYVLIALEVLFMVTPFALYFYGVYGPVLELLESHRATAWTVDFFLPHMVFVDNALLNGLAYLQILFIAGMVLFFLAAAPLYYGRWTGKGVVSFGLYGKMRHPQYLFLAISGFGLLLYWPRFIVLIFFICMLFVYYLLARNEEWRMQREQPGAYERYMETTFMFLPGDPGGGCFGGCSAGAVRNGSGCQSCLLWLWGLPSYRCRAEVLHHRSAFTGSAWWNFTDFGLPTRYA